MRYREVDSLVEKTGLRVRGHFHLQAEDAVPSMPDGSAAQSLVLLGNIGGSLWPAFSASPEYHDGKADPLDRWSKRIVDRLAHELDGAAAYPFSGPSYHPFQQWAQKGDSVKPSPIGLLIHPDYGLWHAYRGALLLGEQLIDPPERIEFNHPCDSCVERPCLNTCPVSAFSVGHYDAPACGQYLTGPRGQVCTTIGCAARNACPIGVEYRYEKEQIGFHMGVWAAKWE